MRSRSLKIFSFIILFTVLLLSFFEASILSYALEPSVSQGAEVPTTPRGFNIVINNLNMTNIMEHVKFLSSEPRFTGYPGFFKAAEYIASKFREYGLQPYGENGTYFEYFNVTVPFDHGSSIALENGKVIKAYMLYPNYVNPCPYKSPEDGDTLVYLGKGEFEDFEGLDVKGKFVLMDFASRWNFYQAIAGGAKGVIFVPEDPEMVTRLEAEQKEVLIPILFPRLYVKLEEGGEELVRLAKGGGAEGIKVHVNANMSWESIRVPNIVGYIEGKDEILSKQVIVVSAYYDSWSIVPALSYGATDSLGVADLIEFARFLSTHRPKRSVLIVALAGHYQSLWGAREFVEKHFADLQSKIIAFAGMDLSSGSKQIGVYATGSAYPYQRPDILYQTRYSWLVSQLFQVYLSEMRMIPQLGINYGERFVDGILGSHPADIGSIRPYEPRVYGFFSQLGASSSIYYQSYTYLFDSDPFVLAVYGCGFTYHTSDDVRLYQRTPSDTWEKINFNNLPEQLFFIHCTLWGLLNESNLRLTPTKSRFSDDWGYITLTIKVSEYNLLTNWYDPFNSTRHPESWKDVIVVYYTGGGAGATGMYIITKINKFGEAVIRGLKPYQMGFVDAFVVDRKTGKITWATDLGVWQAPGGKGVPLTSHPHEKIISMFPCASIAIIFAFNPSDFRFVRGVIINHATAHGLMIRQNQISSDMYYMAFVMPDTPTEIILTMGERLPIAVLNNADPANPNGKGFILKQGDMMIFGPEEIIKNMKSMVLSRYDKLYGYYTYTPTTQLFYNLVSKYLVLWENAYIRNEVNRLLGRSYFSWTLLLGLYASVMDLTWQVILSLSVIFIVTIPFAFIAERLLFSFQGKNRFFAILIIALLSNFAFSFFHPGFIIANSSPLVLISNCLLIILAPLLLLIINETQSSIKGLRGKVRGAAHFVEISRSGLFASSMNMGIENMKKRKFRTLLTLSSLILLVFGMVSLSSVTITPHLVSGVQSTASPSSFSAITIRATPWTPINEGVYMVLKSSLYGLAAVVPRGFLYPPPQPPRVTQAAALPFIVFSPEKKTSIYGILALSYEEPKVSNIDKLLIPTNPPGRWFTKDDIFAAILPDNVARSLSEELGEEIVPGSKISLWGLTLTVVGIIDSERLDAFYNPDGEKITPIDPSSPTTAVTPNHFYSANVFIIPYSLFSRLVYPTPLSMIVIKPANETVKNMLLNELPYQLSYRIYVAEKDELGYFLLHRQWLGLLGYQYLLIPMFIVAFTILNLMLGSVYERTREIAIYNAIGMSPFHISMSFIVEAISYALPAIFSGYLAGIVITAILIILRVYPQELYPNFSSYAALIALLVSFTVTALSSFYPSLLAAKLAVPSRVRRWQKSITKPKGDLWELTIPIVVNTKEETLGIFQFIKEYLSFSMERESLFAAEKISMEEIKKDGGEVLRLITDCRLAPYDLGIKSDIIIEGEKINKDAPFLFKLVIRRTAGYATTWRTSCPYVADEIRKQILIWRTIPPEERRRYIEVARKEYGFE